MVEIYHFPKTTDQREAEHRLVAAMTNLNDAIRHAAKCGFEIRVSQVEAHATYSAAPVPYVNIAAYLPGRPRQPEFTEF